MNALSKLREFSSGLVHQPMATARKDADLYFDAAHRRATIVRFLFIALVALPTAVSALYYGIWAAPRYVSETQFLVRKAHTIRSPGIDAFLKTLGGSQQADDTSVVTGYVLSRDAVRSIEAQLPVRKIFSAPEADLFSRFPRFWRGNSFERLYDYFLDRVTVYQDPRTGLSVLSVQTFRPADSKSLAEVLVGLAEKAVNDLNRRAENDTLNFAWSELGRAQQKLIDAQQALTAFRTKELLVDPTKASSAILETISNLSRDLVQVLAQRQQILTSAPDSPAGQTMLVRAQALQKQIDQERAKLAGSSSSLAPTVSTYERLTLLRELAEKDVANAQGALELARQEVQRQHLYIQMPVAPNLPDESTEPERLRAIATVFVTGFAIFSFIWILMVGAGEHAHR